MDRSLVAQVAAAASAGYQREEPRTASRERQSLHRCSCLLPCPGSPLPCRCRASLSRSFAGPTSSWVPYSLPLELERGRTVLDRLRRRLPRRGCLGAPRRLHPDRAERRVGRRPRRRMTLETVAPLGDATDVTPPAASPGHPWICSDIDSYQAVFRERSLRYAYNSGTGWAIHGPDYDRHRCPMDNVLCCRSKGQQSPLHGHGSAQGHCASRLSCLFGVARDPEIHRTAGRRDRTGRAQYGYPFLSRHPHQPTGRGRRLPPRSLA